MKTLILPAWEKVTEEMQPYLIGFVSGHMQKQEQTIIQSLI